MEASNGETLKAEVVLLSDLDAATPHWWRVRLGSDHSIASVAPAYKDFVRITIGIPRSIAAYVFLNDLAGGDAPFPRDGCAKIFDAWFGTSPAVNLLLQRAIAESPEQDSAWRASAEIRRSPWSIAIQGYRATASASSTSCEIGGAAHTYAIVSRAQPNVLGPAPLCVVGDERCARYYVWP